MAEQATLDQLLAGCLVHDNNVRKAAEEQLKKIAKDPRVVPELLQRVHASPDATVRQLAAVLLRKKITGHWNKLSNEIKESTKAILLENIAKEPMPPVRRACADVVSVIAKHTVPIGQWDGLLEFLYQCFQQPDEDHRELALMLFSSLTETIGDCLRPHFNTLQGIFLSGLRDSSLRVRIAALQAVGGLVVVTSTDAEVAKFQELLAPILDVGRQCLAAGEEEQALKVFEMLDDLVETPAPIVNPVLPQVVQFACEVAANRGLELNTRDKALNVVTWMTRWKPKQLTRHRLVAPILQVVLPLCAEPAGETPAPDDDTGDMPAHKFASQCVDALALRLPAKHVFPVVAEYAASTIRSASADERHAAVLVLAVCAQGCGDVMRDHVEELLPHVLQGLADADPRVRGAAAFALGQFAENLQPAVVEHYSLVLPRLFDVLKDPTPEVQERGIYALDAFCEHMDEEIVPYMEPLMSKLNEVLAGGGRRDLQEIALSAMASAAAASEGAFQAYAGNALPLLGQFMSLTDDEGLGARARATECAGLVASALGKEACRNFLPQYIALALKGYDLDYSEVREYNHGFFGTVATLLGPEFVPYLSAVIPHVFATCQLDDGTIFGEGSNDDEDCGGGGGGGGGPFGDVSSDEDEGGFNYRSLSVRTGVLDEKSAAVQCLGLMARHTLVAFLPFLEQSLSIVTQKMAGYFHEQVRAQALEACEPMVLCALAAYPLQPPSPSPVGPGGPPAPQQSQQVIDACMAVLLRALEQDDDKEAVTAAVRSLTGIVKAAGARPIAAHLPSLAEHMLSLLSNKALCQTLESDDEGAADLDDDEEGDEEDEQLLDAMSELMPALCHAVGPAEYAPLFDKQLEALLRWVRPQRSDGERATAVAALAEVGRELGAAVQPHVPRVLPVVMKEVTSDDSGNRRNAAYCIGVWCEHGGEAAAPHFARVLGALHPLFGAQEDRGVLDNACGAVARMIIAGRASLPLAQVLPVLMGALPVQEDMDEAGPVCTCLAGLIVAGDPEVAPHVPRAVAVFGEAAAHDGVDGAAKQRIGAAVAALQQGHAAEVTPLLAALPPDQQAALASWVAVATTG